METTNVFIETGKKRTFASAADWPGWSRSGKDEEAALQALVDYGPRYALVIQRTELGFHPPAEPSELEVIERSQGDATTDFGAPSIPAEVEKEPLDQAAFGRFKTLLDAYWRAFDRAVRRAQGKELRKGPRGGGRDLEKIIAHVTGSDQGYLRSLGWKPGKTDEMDPQDALRQTRKEIVAALKAAAKGELPEQGPRGGKIWPARYFVRRLAWHLLDHAWEVEDRLM